MSAINSVRKLQILYFSKKNKELKKTKRMAKKSYLILEFKYSTFG